LIIDEAHNIRESKDEGGIKGITRAMENLVKTADGLVLAFLTATPMYDTFEEVIFYMNLFLWNDRKQAPNESIKTEDIFHSDGSLKAGQSGERFRTWCQNYVSYVKGENPFTFPFRLSPPKVIDTSTISKSFLNKSISEPFRYLQSGLVESIPTGIQKEALTRTEKREDEERKRALMETTLAVLPGGKEFGSVFRASGKQYAYVGEPCLTPQALPLTQPSLSMSSHRLKEGWELPLCIPTLWPWEPDCLRWRWKNMGMFLQDEIHCWPILGTREPPKANTSC
jgi:hypothetical protein